MSGTFPDKVCVCGSVIHIFQNRNEAFHIFNCSLMFQLVERDVYFTFSQSLSFDLN